MAEQQPDALRNDLHRKFRELGYTTNSQTSELLDIVFAALSRLQADNERLKAELDDMEAERDDALRGPWPEWAEQIRKRVREGSGYDGYDDVDGVDLPGEVSEHLDEVEAMAERERAERIKAQGEAKALAAMVDRLQAGGGEVRELVELCRSALAEELSAWDIDPPLRHVKTAHDACASWLSGTAASRPAAPAKVLVRRWVAAYRSKPTGHLIHFSRIVFRQQDAETIVKQWQSQHDSDVFEYIALPIDVLATHNGLTLGTDGDGGAV